MIKINSHVILTTYGVILLLDIAAMKQEPVGLRTEFQRSFSTQKTPKHSSETQHRRKD